MRFLADIIAELPREDPASAEARLREALTTPRAFLELGAGAGDALAWCEKTFASGPGLGLEVNPAKLDKAKALGRPVIPMNLDVLPALKGVVDYTTLIHVIEHIPSLPRAEEIIRKAVGLAREFAYIRQPFFDADAHLFSHGLKLYWSDWTGHPNRMTSLEFHNIARPLLEDGTLAHAVIGARGAIPDSGHPAVLPASAPIDQHDFDPARHGFKPPVTFTEPVFSEIVAMFARTDAALSHLDDLGFDHILFDSRN